MSDSELSHFVEAERDYWIKQKEHFRLCWEGAEAERDALEKRRVHLHENLQKTLQKLYLAESETKRKHDLVCNLRAELDEAHAIIRELTAALRDVQNRPGRTAKVIRQGEPDGFTGITCWHESEG
jgi:chromosome segregation ATPase